MPTGRGEAGPALRGGALGRRGRALPAEPEPEPEQEPEARGGMETTGPGGSGVVGSYDVVVVGGGISGGHGGR